MLKSCKFCGRIHDSNYTCELRPKRKYNKRDSRIDIFRSSALWQKKRETIKKRDLNLCQICIRNLSNTNFLYKYKDLQVHHIIPIQEDWDKRLDDDNLITLCPYHQKLAEKGKITRKKLLEIVEEQENSLPPLL